MQWHEEWEKVWYLPIELAEGAIVRDHSPDASVTRNSMWSSGQQPELRNGSITKISR